MDSLNYPLNEQQLHFLKMFSKELPREDWEHIRKYLSEYFANKLMDEMDRVWDEKGWSDETILELSKGHFRNQANTGK